MYPSSNSESQINDRRPQDPQYPLSQITTTDTELHPRPLELPFIHSSLQTIFQKYKLKNRNFLTYFPTTSLPSSPDKSCVDPDSSMVQFLLYSLAQMKMTSNSTPLQHLQIPLLLALLLPLLLLLLKNRKTQPDNKLTLSPPPPPYPSFTLPFIQPSAPPPKTRTEITNPWTPSTSPSPPSPLTKIPKKPPSIHQYPIYTPTTPPNIYSGHQFPISNPTSLTSPYLFPFIPLTQKIPLLNIQ